MSRQIIRLKTECGLADRLSWTGVQDRLRQIVSFYARAVRFGSDR